MLTVHEPIHASDKPQCKVVKNLQHYGLERYEPLLLMTLTQLVGVDRVVVGQSAFLEAVASMRSTKVVQGKRIMGILMKLRDHPDLIQSLKDRLAGGKITLADIVLNPKILHTEAQHTAHQALMAALVPQPLSPNARCLHCDEPCMRRIVQTTSGGMGRKAVEQLQYSCGKCGVYF